MISVIVPIYNAEQYLQRTADCIRNQTFSDYEVLLINDGSQDNSESICREIEKIDHRFRTISQSNSGVSAARNRGMREANGAYIAFLDADDVIPENYLEALYRSLNEHNAQMSVCDVAVVEGAQETGRFTCKVRELTNTEALNRLLCRNEINSGPCAKLFRREVIQNTLFPPLKAYEDILFVADVMCNCCHIAATDQTEYRYEQNQSGAMSTFRKMPSMDIVQATKMLLELIGKIEKLDPNCLYTTLSHLMQYAIPLIGNGNQRAKQFVLASQKLVRQQTGKIRKCSAFPWKEKILFILFAHGWYYSGHKITRI